MVTKANTEVRKEQRHGRRWPLIGAAGARAAPPEPNLGGGLGARGLGSMGRDSEICQKIVIGKKPSLSHPS